MIISVRNLVTKFGSYTVHSGLNFDIPKSSVTIIMGGSGSGKTTLLRELVMLDAPTSGSIKVCGEEVVGMKYDESQRLKKRFGVAFQSGALFSGMSVIDNVAFVLTKILKMDYKSALECSAMKLSLVGYPMERIWQYPANISGGMIKRASIARALALDPQILFLDEPTSGLDPASSREFNKLLVNLRDLLGTTIVAISHDPQTALTAAEQLIVLGRKIIVFDGVPKDALSSNDTIVKEILQGD